jgi:hypothetical protein
MMQGELRNPKVREELVEEPGRYCWNKESRFKTAAASEEGEDNRQLLQRTERETGATFGKQNARQIFRKTVRWGSQSKQLGLPLDCEK